MARNNKTKSVKQYIEEGESSKLFIMGITSVVVLCFFVMIIFFTTNAMLMEKREYKRFVKTAVMVQAECQNVRTKTETYTTRSRHHTHTHHRTVYYADISYQYKQTNYHIQNVRMRGAVNSGSRISIYISPDHPEKFKFPAGDTNLMMYIIFWSVFLLPMGIMGWHAFRCFWGVGLAKQNQNHNGEYSRNISNQNRNNYDTGSDNDWQQNDQAYYDSYFGENGYGQDSSLDYRPKKDIDSFQSFNSDIGGDDQEQW